MKKTNNGGFLNWLFKSKAQKEQEHVSYEQMVKKEEEDARLAHERLEYLRDMLNQRLTKDVRHRPKEHEGLFWKHDGGEIIRTIDYAEADDYIVDLVEETVTRLKEQGKSIYAYVPIKHVIEGDEIKIKVIEPFHYVSLSINYSGSLISSTIDIKGDFVITEQGGAK